MGTYLTDLTMIDTAIPDYTDGLINFDKKRREFEVLAQVRTNNKCIPVWKLITYYVYYVHSYYKYVNTFSFGSTNVNFLSERNVDRMIK